MAADTTHNSASTDNNGSDFIDFNTLHSRIPLCERTLRDQIRSGDIPSILLPGSRKFIFHWPSVEAALRRRQQSRP